MKDIIYSLGIIITLVIGFWNIINTYRISRRTSFINTVTNERIQRIERLRQNISSFCGLTHTWCWMSPDEQQKQTEIFRNIDKLRYLIRLQLSPEGKQELKIQELIAKIPDLTNEFQQYELMNAINELVSSTQLLLKEEWEKVKKESKCGDLKEKECGIVELIDCTRTWYKSKTHAT
jgi:hypothetical protein